MEVAGREASELTRIRTGLYQELDFLKQQGIYFLNATAAEKSLFESGLLTQQNQSGGTEPWPREEVFLLLLQKYAAFASALPCIPAKKTGAVIYLAYFSLLFATLSEVGQTSRGTG